MTHGNPYFPTSRFRLPAGTLLLAIILAFWPLPSPNTVRALTASDLIVVFNRQMAESREVADYYAELRGVPAGNLLGVDTSVTEGVRRSDYESGLAAPIGALVRKLQDQGKNPAVLLVYGVPLKVLDNRGIEADTEFVESSRAKAGTLETLIRNMTGELDRLSGRTPVRPSPSPDRKPNEITQFVLAEAIDSVNAGVNLLKSDRAGKLSRQERIDLSSFLIRMGGLAFGSRAYLDGLSASDKASPQAIQNQDILKWNMILQSEIDYRMFTGVSTEEADGRAASIRLSQGLLGELRYWFELSGAYEKNLTAASVDSELSLMLVDRYQKPSWLPNPHHERHDRLPWIEEVRRRTIKVSRLDGPTPEHARRLARDAAAVENTGLRGIFYIDARGLKEDGKPGGYAWYDAHLLRLHRLLGEQSKMKVILDSRKELFDTGCCPEAALYTGWYSLRNYVDSFAWKTGSVGFHVASSEATTLRDASANTWCKRMIEKGVAATLGPVAEPFLTSFPLPDHFFPLLMTGRQPLLDVYFQSIPHVSWRQTLIGDPLYNPFKKSPAIKEAPPFQE